VTRSPGCVVNINDDDEVTQVNEQTANQEVHKNNDVGDGGLILSPTIQKATSTALNYNADKDVVIVLGCNYESVDRSDDDKVTQVNEQTVNQEVLSDSEVGDGGLILSPTIQKATSTALNYNADNDHVLIPLPNL
jgi:rRNA maturation endonuclease Nob1